MTSTGKEREPGGREGRQSGRSGARFPPARPAPDTPPSQTEMVQYAREADRAAKLPQTAEAGCEEVRPAPRYRYWGPPAPRVSSRLVAGSIAIRFKFDRLPSSPACRPFALDLIVSSGTATKPGYVEASQRFLVTESSGTAAIRVPPRGQPPYLVRVRTVTIDQRPSREVRAEVG